MEQGEAAWEALCELRQELERQALATVREAPSSAWLWYLRRARWLWSDINDMPTTAPYVAYLAEALSSRSDAAEPAPMLDQGFLSYPIDPVVAARLMRLRAAAALLYHTHAALRWAGKGAEVFGRADRIPGVRPSASLAKSVQLFDQRCANDPSGILTLAGLHLSRRRHDLSHVAAGLPLFAYGRQSIGLDVVPLNRIPMLNDPALPIDVRWPRPLLDLVVLAWTFPLSEAVQSEALPHLPLHQTGYRVVVRGTLLAELHMAAEFIDSTRLDGAIPKEVRIPTADEILVRLLAEEGSLWPPLPPPLRLDPDGRVVIDLESVSHSVAIALARPPISGAQVNAWAGHFERDLQRSIDGTRWHPGADLAQMRGRTLRVGGRAVTDLDAVGERNGMLLLVSGKAVPFTPEFDRGEYRAVTNVAHHIDQSVADWTDRVSQIRTTPKGDNYNFAAYHRIIGVIAYPHTPWTTSTKALDQVASGLRAVVSASELERWCRGSKW